jgi:large subunit ribosomal protein L25
MADRLTIEVEPREASGSRSARRLRRSGFVPGVLYGGSHQEGVSFQVGTRELRRVLVDGAALIDVKFGKEKTVPAILKDRQIHPVRGEVTHIDFLEVDLKEKIRAMVSLELLGADEAVGVKDGGILDHATREVEIEALPTDIPECIEVDVSELNVGDTLTLDKVTTPDGVELVHEHLEDVVVASVVVPTKVEEPEIEEETELVGEAAEGEAAEAGDDSGDSGGGE